MIVVSSSGGEVADALSLRGLRVKTCPGLKRAKDGCSVSSLSSRWGALQCTRESAGDVARAA